MGLSKKQTAVKWVVSSCAVALAIVHLVIPKSGIDSVIILLLTITILPWLLPLLKSLELPGGLKIEFNDLLRVEHDAREIGLIETPEKKDHLPDYPFMMIADSHRPS